MKKKIATYLNNSRNRKKINIKSKIKGNINDKCTATSRTAGPDMEAKDTREIVDITELNAEIKTTVAKIDRLRAEIDSIIAEIEA